MSLLGILIAISLSASDTPGIKNIAIPEPSVNKTMLLQLVNTARKKGCQCGDKWFPSAPPVTWNELLEKAAFNHSLDMNTNNYFSHAAKDGSKAGSRLNEVGYSWRAYGENIAFGYADEKEVVQGWLKSPGHCSNIMNASFKEMGVAKSGTYWTQAFGAKR